MERMAASAVAVRTTGTTPPARRLERICCFVTRASLATFGVFENSGAPEAWLGKDEIFGPVDKPFAL